MKILLVFFGDDYHGGTTFSTLTIAKELVRRGHEVHAYARVTPAGTLARDLEACGVTVHDGRSAILVHPIYEGRVVFKAVRFLLEQARRFHTYPKSEREVEKIIRTHGIELVAISSGAIATGVQAAQATGTPFVWHVREFMQEDHGLDYYPWAHVYEHMSEARYLICVSHAVEEKMHRVCPGAKTAVVYNGLDLDVFYPPQDSDEHSGQAARLMFSGGLKHSKGAFLLLDALAKLPKDLSYTLDVFGTEGGAKGESAHDYLAYAQSLGLSDVIRYHGVTNNIADQYRCHDIQIVASRCEAFGRVTAESMLCKCAVVGSASGGTPELIAEDRGYLFEPNDADSLALVLNEALSDSAERNRRVERAYAYASENFSVNAYVDSIEEVYRAALA